MLKNSQDIFLLVDGHALIYRAYHAFPPLSDLNGQLVNALYGFLRVLLSTIKDLSPKYVAVTFDHPSPPKRKQAYALYKANRKEMPADLQPQIALIQDAVSKLGMPVFQEAGEEADDLIGTITKTTSQLPDLYTLILTGDRDTFQLVDQNVNVYLSQIGLGKKNGGSSTPTIIDEAAVLAKTGVTPAQIIDLKALSGDSSDNIPGVFGVGAVSATKLLQNYGTLDKIYDLVDKGGDENLLKGRLLDKLQAGKKEAYLSRDLATIDRGVKLNFNCQACELSNYDKDIASVLLQKYGFNSLLKMLPADEFEAGVQAELF